MMCVVLVVYFDGVCNSDIIFYMDNVIVWVTVDERYIIHIKFYKVSVFINCYSDANHLKLVSMYLTSLGFEGRSWPYVRTHSSVVSWSWLASIQNRCVLKYCLPSRYHLASDFVIAAGPYGLWNRLSL